MTVGRQLVVSWLGIATDCKSLTSYLACYVLKPIVSRRLVVSWLGIEAGCESPTSYLACYALKPIGSRRLVIGCLGVALTISRRPGFYFARYYS